LVVEEVNAVTVGAVVSTVTVRLEDVDVTVESESTVVDIAVIALSPAVRTPVSHVHAPVVEFAVHAFPEFTPSTCNCTVEPTGAEPVNVSVVTEVILSVDEAPESSAVSRTGVDTLGTAYRITTIPDPPTPPEILVPPPPPPPPPRPLVPAEPVVL
jgi:hypothetical protein